MGYERVREMFDTYNEYYRLTVCSGCSDARKFVRKCHLSGEKRYCEHMVKARTSYFKEAITAEIMGVWCAAKVGMGKVLLPGEVFPAKAGWEERFARKFEKIKKVVGGAKDAGSL
jgi:hypothetical protein